MKIQAQRGTEDVLPSQAATWQRLEQQFRDLVHHYGYAEIRTPVFEDVQLFKRTAGETSDIVSKEMYEFKDKGGRDIALKPEGTAPAIRAAIEHNLCPQGTHTRLYYQTACYRYGRPGAGRLRELHQFGAELLGANSADADAEVIEIAYRFFDSLGLGGAPILLNSIGGADCRSKYASVILEHVSGYLKDADEETKARIEKNPMGMLDSKDPAQKEALVGVPSILDFLEDESKARFEKLQMILSECEVPFKVSPDIVRGLDYYNDTVFEYETPVLPGLSSFAGGRYDKLVKQLSGAQTPCVGFGIGVERLILGLKAIEKTFSATPANAFLVQASDDAEAVIRKLALELRRNGLTILRDVDGRSMKSQMRQADGSGAKFAVIIGEEELKSDLASVRNLKTSEQIQVPFDRLHEVLK